MCMYVLFVMSNYEMNILYQFYEQTQLRISIATLRYDHLLSFILTYTSLNVSNITKTKLSLTNLEVKTSISSESSNALRAM